MAEQSRVIHEALKSVYNINEIHYWIDSAIVYSWILNVEKKYDAYITRRVEKMRSIITPLNQLRLVPSKLNPADIGTRGMAPKELLNNREFWFCGPEFLKLRKDSWPNFKVGEKFIDSYEKNVENPSSVLIVKSADGCNKLINPNGSVGEGDKIKEIDIANIIDIKKFSSINKLYKVTALVIRFKNKLLDILNRKKENRRINPKRNNKSMINKDILTSNDMIESKLLWVKSAQSSVMMILSSSC